MKSIAFLAIILVSGSFADLQKSAAHGNTTLEYYSDNLNTAGAISRCCQLGGWLVMPKYDALDAAVAAISGDRKVWIGLGDFEVEGVYEYIDRTGVTWSNWRSGEPNNAGPGGEDCVERRDGGWNDITCSYRQGFVCQIPNSHRTQYHYSHLKVYRGLNETTHAKAAAACERQNSSLVKVTDEHSTRMLFDKLTQKTDFAFWAIKEEDDAASCCTASYGSVDVINCERKIPFICEAVKPHRVIVSEHEPFVSEHSNLEISCSAYGYPVPEVTWYHNDVEVVHQVKESGHSTLKVHNVTSANNGLYVCRAANVIDNRKYEMEGYSTIKVTSEGITQ